ncbi:hypothetical protein CEUSTIGMA_g5460.t1 [Chlamydomonas eustigma]|uniref:OTU domain-containing protein n=1 Tax=Chlamydomonas eustigma TaxID=1157962 RepID=A0A250X4L0_9CHLO|nr:hypothetical protein CEUSTIGMA_g5460.t1 [Chlamydomonas eustigma]|eukprot:GAX78018.1 hypothetical protein CEUSTIGMA_g5460.t1 [Chlamydomonas eustigma]
MGKKGMKGFMRSAQERNLEDRAEADDSMQPVPSQGCSVETQTKVADAATRATEALDAGSSDDEDTDGPETRGQMLKRHQREMQAHKKTLQRMGKKSKEELAKLNQEIEERHSAELKALENTAPKEESAEERPSHETEELCSDVSALTLESKKPSKAMKRREKMEQEEVERMARIAEEGAGMGPSSREKEEEALSQLLTPLGVCMKEIKADGHCLYRSIEDQLVQLHHEPSVSYQQLRERAAAFIREHPDEYIPYIYDEDKEGDPKTQLERYCTEMTTTAVWGGQTELKALAEVLQRRIQVLAVGLPPVEMGECYTGPALRVCYLRHAFGLGEHYNSVQPTDIMSTA